MDEANLIHRIEVLEEIQAENKSFQNEILKSLSRIEHRLIGDIDQDKPGLIDDMRALRRTVESIDARIISIEKSNLQNRLEILEEEYQKTKEKIEELSKYRLMLYGGIVVAVFVIQKLWSVIKF